jgi:hypothetical protein
LGNLLPEDSFGGITGRAVTLVRITSNDMTNCSFPLKAGLNLFSAYCLGTQDQPNATFSALSRLEGVFSFEPMDSGGDIWKIYNPSLPAWVVQDLSAVTRKKGYAVIMLGPEVFGHEGVNKDSDTIDVIQGWNFIGYPVNTSHPVNVTFNSISGRYTEVVTYNATDTAYVRYIVGGANNTLVETPPYYGYWINMTQARTIIITR